MQNVYNLVHKKCTEHADYPALVDGKETWSYARLLETVALWADRIRQQIPEERFVGIGNQRDASGIIGILAIHKAGKAYVPLDEQLPEEQIQERISQLNLRYLFPGTCQTNMLTRFPDLREIKADTLEIDIPSAVSDDLGYVLFTSGSTGIPKGVCMPHAALENLIAWQGEVSLCGKGTRTLQFAPLSFDVSFQEIYATLSSGGCLFLIGEQERLDARRLGAFLMRHRINRLFLPFVALQALADSLHATKRYPKDLKEIITAGETLKITPSIRSMAEQIPGLSLCNQYGPTECHVVTQRRLEGTPDSWPDLPDIGYPISGTYYFVLDAGGIEPPADQAGELCIAGICLARGYLGDPAKTKERFIDWTDGAGKQHRLYRTGDQVQRNSDGSLRFLGRMDQQVKLRGHRIELEAIELALAQLEGVQQAAVVLRDAGMPESRLVAYLTGKRAKLNHSAIRSQLAKNLPEHMIPAKTIWLEELPKTPSGKVDKKALPTPASKRPELDTEYRKWTNSTERRLCAHWEQLLQVSPVGITDSFFDLGGNSLNAQKTVVFMGDLLGKPIPVIRLYRYPTIASLLQDMQSGKSHTSKPVQNSRQAGNEIAVIGMALRFPGASNADEFWAQLKAGEESIRFFSDQELDPSISATIRHDPLYVKARGVLKDADQFDPGFFGISPTLAAVMDPQQRLFLELSRDTLETAGYLPFRYSGRIGVFGGCGNNTYYSRHVQENPEEIHKVGEFQAMCVNEKDYIASRTAYQLDLNGPAVSLFTACSTSATAVAMAVDQLRLGRCDLALAGGVAITAPVHSGHLYQEGAMLSQDGHCRPFDARANGTVFSDGGAVVLLKDAEKARQDGDRIYGLIRGIAVNNDGRDKGSFTAPNSRGQAQVIRQAWADAGIRPEDIQYIETHGTATPLGDPIEIEGLTMAFEESGSQANCFIGSVKSNFGHLTAAAGIAGLIKTLLALQYKQIPPTLHFNALNPHIDFKQHRFHISSELNPWPETRKRIAGLSSFGVGGTNVHLVLQAESPPDPAPENARPRLITWASKKRESQEEFSRKLQAYCRNHPEQSMRDLAYSLQVTREAFAYRDFRVAGSVPGLLQQLETFKATDRTAKTDLPPIVFVFPGQGAQYPGMGKELYALYPAFKKALDRCALAMRSHLELDIRELIFDTSGAASKQLNQTQYTQPALFAHGYALNSLWESLGIQATAYLGHSVGELLAAHLAGIFSFEDAVALLCFRAGIMAKLPEGRMLSVRGLQTTELEELKHRDLSLAVVNGPASWVISGGTETIHAYQEALQDRNIPCKMLATAHAFHSPAMDPLLPRIEAYLNRVKRTSPHKPIISTVTGDFLEEQQAISSTYWSEQLRGTVQFSKAITQASAKMSPLFLELGPSGVCTQYLRQHGREFNHAAIASLPLGAARSEAEQWLHAVGELWRLGYAIHWERLYPGEPLRIEPDLPAYAYDKKSYWLPASITRKAATSAANGHPASFINPIPFNQKSPQMNTLPIEALQTSLEDITGLELQGCDPECSFIDLGMDSLLLTQMATRLKQRYQVPLTYRQLNEEFNTLNKLSAYLQRQEGRPETDPALPDHAPEYVPARGQEQDVEKPFGARPQINKDRAELNETQIQYLHRFTQRYNQKTAKSKAFTQVNRANMADPRVVAGFRPETKELVYPLVVQRSEGCRLWDIDGNAYIDVLNGFGSNLFGYQPGFIKRALHDQIEKGFELGPQHPLAGAVCASVCRLTGQDRAALCNTGSEAVLGALRIARTLTGKNPIIAFKGSYHGINDEVIVRGKGPGKSQPAAPGIPAQSVENLWVLDYGTPESLEIIRAHAGQIAGILVEPVQSRRLDFMPMDFLRELRNITRQHGALLIFDEVITGFRAHPGGVQALWNLRADLSTYGKVIGGGMPIGVIAGKAEFMDALDGGHWAFGDASVPESGVTYFAGTFVRHPLTLAAAHAALQYLEQQGPEFQHQLDEETRFLTGRMNEVIAELGVPLKVHRFSSVWRMEHTRDYPLQELLYVVMREKGIHIQDRFPCFLTQAHSREDILQILQAFKESLQELVQAGLIPVDQAKAGDLLESFVHNRPPLEGARLGRDPQGNPAWFVPDPDNQNQYLQIEL